MKGKILLCENTKEETTHALEKYAFSNAMALSGKINIHRVACIIFAIFWSKFDI